jgi:hypothetical protein
MKRLAPALILCLGALATARADPAANEAAIKELRRDLADEYSHEGLRKIPWDDLFRQHHDALAAAATPRDFAVEAGALLAKAEDMHIHLEVSTPEGSAPIWPFLPPGNLNFDLGVLKKVVPHLTGDRCAISGRFDDGIGYLTMDGLFDPCAVAAKAAFSKLAGPENHALIIDLRPNNGGDDRIAAWMAGCLVDKKVRFAQIVTRAHGKLSPAADRELAPNPDCPHFAGRVAVLVGPKVVSSAEAFALMLRAAGAKLYGTTTGGASGNPQPHPLGNGVTVFLPSWRELFPDGSPLEGKGIHPDVEVVFDAHTGADAVIAAALADLRR